MRNKMKYQLVLAAVILLLLHKKKLLVKSNYAVQVVFHSWYNPSNTLRNGDCCAGTSCSLSCNSRFLFFSCNRTGCQQCDRILNTTLMPRQALDSSNVTFCNYTLLVHDVASVKEFYLGVRIRHINCSSRPCSRADIDQFCIPIHLEATPLTLISMQGSGWQMDHQLLFSYGVNHTEGYCGHDCSTYYNSLEDNSCNKDTPMNSGSNNSKSIIGGVIACITVTTIIVGVLVTYMVLRRRKRVGTTSGEECTDINCRFSPGDNRLYSGAMVSHTTEIPKQKQVPDTKFGTLSCHEYECTDFVVNKSNNTDGVYEAAYATIDSPAEHDHEEESLPQSEHYCFQFGGGGVAHAPQIYDSDNCVAFPDPESDSETDGVYEFEQPMPKQNDDLGDYPTLIRTESVLNGLMVECNPAYVSTTK